MRDVEIDKELITRFGPAGFVAGEQLNHAAVHQRNLRLNVVAMPPQPVITGQAGLNREGRSLKQLALVGRGTARD